MSNSNFYQIKKAIGITLLFLISLFFSNCSVKTVANDKSLSINILDSLFLINEIHLPRYIDYNRRNQLYLSVGNEEGIEHLYLHEKRGRIVEDILLASDGTDKITQVVNRIFDEAANEIVVLTQTEVIAFSLDGKLKSRCNLEEEGIIYAGFDGDRIISYEDYYILSLLSKEEEALQIGSPNFMSKANPIKIINKSDCKCVQKIGYPKNSILQEGIFQPTFYEPMISLDEKNKELEVVFFQVEGKIYTYALPSFKYKTTINLSLEEMDYPQSVDRENAFILKSKFQQDHNKGQIFTLLNFEGKTLIGYKKSKEWRQQAGNEAHYLILDQQGNQFGDFSFNDFSAYDFIVDHKEGNQFFAFPDFDSFTEEPIGYPLHVIEIR